MDTQKTFNAHHKDTNKQKIKHVFPFLLILLNLGAFVAEKTPTKRLGGHIEKLNHLLPLLVSP